MKGPFMAPEMRGKNRPLTREEIGRVLDHLHRGETLEAQKLMLKLLQERDA